MDNKKELYYHLEYIKSKKNGVGAIKIKLCFKQDYMRYEEFDLITNDVETLIYIRDYDYDLAVEALLEADKYKAGWLYIKFF